MRDYPQIKQTRREFIREKRKQITAAKRIYRELSMGSALHGIYGGSDFYQAVRAMRIALNKMDRITKPLA